MEAESLDTGGGDPGGSVGRWSCFRDILMRSDGDMVREESWDFVEEGNEGDELEDELVAPLPEDVKNAPRLVLSREERQEIRQLWLRALIIKLIGKMLPYNFFVEHLRLRWQVQGEMEVIDIGNDFYVVKLSLLEERARVLSEGTWVIAGHYLSVQSWKSNFDPFQDTIKSMAVWIRLPFLPFEYYQPQLLFKIGNLVGKTLKVDWATEFAQLGKFARLCVELDVTKPLIPKVVIGSKIQKVEYEGLGIVYFCCGCIGHHVDSCPIAKCQIAKSPQSHVFLACRNETMKLPMLMNRIAKTIVFWLACSSVIDLLLRWSFNCV